MKLTKSKLKQIIKEEIAETQSRIPSARDFGSTEPEMHAQFDAQKERIEDYMADARALHAKMAQYINDYENTGPAGQSDLGGLTPKWRALLDALSAVKDAREVATKTKPWDVAPRETGPAGTMRTPSKPQEWPWPAADPTSTGPWE